MYISYRKSIFIADMWLCLITNSSAIWAWYSPMFWFLVLIPTRVLGLPQSIETDKRPDKKFTQGFTGGPCCSSGEQEQLTSSLACSRGRGEVSWFLIWGEGRGVSRGRARGVA